jgi:hypothetical protein
LRAKDGAELFDAGFGLRQAKEKKKSIKAITDSSDGFQEADTLTIS